MKPKKVIPIHITPKARRQFAQAGSRGGTTSAANLTKDERMDRARKAAAARWTKKQGD